MRRLLASWWPGIPLGLLLLPTATLWLDGARSVAPSRYAYRQPARRVVVLGFDGVDYDLLAADLDRFPELRRLRDEGAFTPCRTTNPPESPVAWATFATGLNPGGHGILDFVRRDPETYTPLNGMVAREPPAFGPLGVPLRPVQAINLRRGEGFWEPVARAGYRVSVLRMPLTFPATLPRGGELLSGLGVPDLRGTQGSYTLFAAGAAAWDGYTQFGGRHVKIYPREGRAGTRLEGPPDPRAQAGGRRLSTPVTFRFASEAASVAVGDAPAAALEPGVFSRWVPVRFRAGPLVTLHGLVRFLLLRTGDAPAVYASPIQIAPGRAPIPISAPRDFAGRIAARLGPMKTAGWPEDTFAANDRVLDDVHAFADIRDTYFQQELLLLDRLDHADAALTAMVFTAQDRAGHLFFRYRDPEHPAHDPRAIDEFARRTGKRDPIRETYRWMNDTVAKVRARLRPEDVLLVVSDHGFHTWRYGVNLNRWLADEGYLALADAGEGRRPRNLDEFFRRVSGTHHVDWSRTRAYALGLGQIYVNLAGRESGGIVAPEDRAALLAEIRAKLARLVGPDGRKCMTASYLAEDIWHGPHARGGPDLQCAFATGYRVSWQTALLGVPPEIFEPNVYPWSGDHCSNDAAQTEGIFFSSHPLGPDAPPPGLENIAPTVCWLFGVPPPEGAEAPHLPLVLNAD